MGSPPPSQGGGGSMPGVNAIVFSRTLTSAPKGAELVTSDAGDYVRALKARPGKDIIVMSGGNLAASLLQAGVIDEIGFQRPSGAARRWNARVSRSGLRVKLELTECRTLDGGCVFVNYRVK